MTRVHVVASFRHYAEHLAPIWRELPDDVRGVFMVDSVRLETEMRAQGVDAVAPRRGGGRLIPERDPVMVAGFRDLGWCRDRPVCLVEHGAGQTYSDTVGGSYAGGRGRDRIGLFLVPNDEVRDANLVRYPSARVAVVGCPRLDDLLAVRVGGGPVGVTFHWPCQVSTEAGTARVEWWDQVERLVSFGVDVLGHGHPRDWRNAELRWRKLGVPSEMRWDRVVSTVSVLVADNSSVMFEAAALGVPVVVLNSDGWRKDVEHGRRFWRDHRLGPVLWPGDDLVDGIGRAVAGENSTEREQAVRRVYEVPPSLNRRSSKLAAREVMSWAL